MTEEKSNLAINRFSTYLDRAIERSKNYNPSHKRGLLLILEKSIELIGDTIGNIIKFIIWGILFFGTIGIIGFIAIALILLLIKLFK